MLEIPAFNMSKIRLVGLAVVLVAAVCFVGLMQRQASRRLTEVSRLWRQEADHVARLTAENARLSNIVAQARRSQDRANEQLRELLQLRSELNGLKQQSNAVAQARPTSPPPAPVAVAEPPLPKPPAEAPSAPVPAANVIPRESWAFAGYATPEAALQTVVWAMSNGDTATYLASLTPAALQYLEQQLENRPDMDLAAMLKEEVAEVRALRLDRKHDAGDGKVSFVLASSEQDDGAARRKDEQLIVLKNIEGEWRVVAAPDE